MYGGSAKKLKNVEGVPGKNMRGGGSSKYVGCVDLGYVGWRIGRGDLKWYIP